MLILNSYIRSLQKFAFQYIFRDRAFMDPDWIMFNAERELCNINIFSNWFCANGFFILFGFDAANWDVVTIILQNCLYVL